jgi:hypothetical protein
MLPGSGPRVVREVGSVAARGARKYFAILSTRNPLCAAKDNEARRRRTRIIEAFPPISAKIDIPSRCCS